MIRCGGSSCGAGVAAGSCPGAGLASGDGEGCGAGEAPVAPPFATSPPGAVQAVAITKRAAATPAATTIRTLAPLHSGRMRDLLQRMFRTGVDPFTRSEKGGGLDHLTILDGHGRSAAPAHGVQDQTVAKARGYPKPGGDRDRIAPRLGHVAPSL